MRGMLADAIRSIVSAHYGVRKAARRSGFESEGGYVASQAPRSSTPPRAACWPKLVRLLSTRPPRSAHNLSGACGPILSFDEPAQERLHIFGVLRFNRQNFLHDFARG